MSYRGRFAPTASGPLHAGSLFIALAGFVQARSQGGRWLLRIDDLDPERCLPGAADGILRQLEDHGLHWDESPRYQSRHLHEYRAALEDLLRQERLFHCACTRAELKRTLRPGVDGPVYAGTCRHLQLEHGALRYRMAAQTLTLEDPVQGRMVREAERDVGDFIVVRSDGHIGYQLACVIDDQNQAVTEIVRGSDLIDSSFRQNVLRAALGLSSPRHLHLPVLESAPGRKLSKQNRAPALDSSNPSANLRDALIRLGQTVPAADERLSPSELLHFAILNWQVDRLPRGLAQAI